MRPARCSPCLRPTRNPTAVLVAGLGEGLADVGDPAPLRGPASSGPGSEGVIGTVKFEADAGGWLSIERWVAPRESQNFLAKWRSPRTGTLVLAGMRRVGVGRRGRRDFPTSRRECRIPRVDHLEGDLQFLVILRLATDPNFHGAHRNEYLPARCRGSLQQQPWKRSESPALTSSPRAIGSEVLDAVVENDLGPRGSRAGWRRIAARGSFQAGRSLTEPCGRGVALVAVVRNRNVLRSGAGGVRWERLICSQRPQTGRDRPRSSDRKRAVAHDRVEGCPHSRGSSSAEKLVFGPVRVFSASRLALTQILDRTGPSRGNIEMVCKAKTYRSFRPPLRRGRARPRFVRPPRGSPSQGQNVTVADCFVCEMLPEARPPALELPA